MVSLLYSPTRFGRCLISTRVVVGLVLALCGNIASAAIYDLNDDVRKLRLNIPDSVTVVRGILVYGNGAGGDSTGQATNAQLVAVAEQLGFAILATGGWGNFGYNDPPWVDFEINWFESRISQLAGMSNHPELVNAPWLPMGHSNGGQMSYGMNTKRPHKVIGFITSKGCCYNNFTPSEAALLTPGMLIAGETDTNLRRTNIRSLFDINRPRGALWAWVEEQGAGHEAGATQELILAFLLECYRLRYPPGASTLDGPIKLKTLNEFDGWLVDQNTWLDGVTDVFPFDDAPVDPATFGWVPSERVARIYQAFSSYNKVSNTVSGASGVRTAPSSVNYQVALTGVNWSRIDFYEGPDKLGEAYVGGGNNPSIAYQATEGRLHSHYGIVTMVDGSQRATHLRRVFVKGDNPPSAFAMWASTELPPGGNAPGGVLFSDGVTNLERFAFGLGTEPQIDRSRLPAVNLDHSGSQPVLVYQYQINEAAVEAGMNMMPEFSLDLSTWTSMAHESLLNPDITIEKTDDQITIRWPAGGPQLFLRNAFSDTP